MKGYVRSFFSPKDDAKLRKLQKQYGENWKEIAKKMKNFSARQCRDRYISYLMTENSGDPWTEEEDLLLLKKYHELGKNWQLIMTFFKRRNLNSVKNRFYRHIRKSYLNNQTTSNGNGSAPIQTSPFESSPNIEFPLQSFNPLEESIDQEQQVIPTMLPPKKQTILPSITTIMSPPQNLLPRIIFNPPSVDSITKPTSQSSILLPSITTIPSFNVSTLLNPSTQADASCSHAHIINLLS